MRVGIGHNLGPPLDTGRSWRRYCWQRARVALMPPAPIEIVRRRVRRAAELGLRYPDYASILLVTGRDLSAFLLTSTALEGGNETVRPDAAARIETLVRCDVLVLKTPGGPSLDTIRETLRLPAGRDGAVAPFAPRAPLSAGRDAIRALLQPFRLPPAAVAMVGTTPLECDWSEAARLARFLPAGRWFGEG